VEYRNVSFDKGDLIFACFATFSAEKTPLKTFNVSQLGDKNTLAC